MSEQKASLKEVVAAFLRNNPEFLKEYPDVLEVLSLSHRSGAAASLIERQVQQLRTQNQDLTRQLNRLVHVATENEQLMSRLHHLTLELLAIDQLPTFFKHLSQRLKEDFRAEIIKVVLFDGDLASMAGNQVTWASSDDDKAKMFHAQMLQGQTICGRLNDSKLSFLFEAKAQWVKSSAVVPIGQGGEYGLLAIGSSDPARFYPGMGTLFLDLLADVIASSLSRVQPQEQRRTA